MNKIISKSLILFIFLIAGILSSCSQDNEILATSTIRNITSEDFHNWLVAKKIKKESIPNQKNKQVEVLESMAIELFTMDKALSEDFDKSKRLTILKNRIRESTLYTYFLKAIMDKATYNEPVIRVSFILLEINWYKQNPGNESKKIRRKQDEFDQIYDELISKSQNIIKKLDKGESFEKLAAEYSEYPTKNKGGDYGYISKHMMPVYFSDPAFKLNKGEYTKTPVMTPKGIYIIKVTGKTNLTEKNINKIIEDQGQQERMNSNLLLQYKNNYIKALQNADDVKFMYIKGKAYNNTDTLFKFGSKDYTLADVDKVMENRLLPEELENIKENGAIHNKYRFRIANKYFKYLLWSREAANFEIEKRPDYLKELKEKEINLIMPEYISTQIAQEIFISDQEILEEYEEGKEFKYSDLVSENGVLVRKPVPLDAVKDEIINKLKEKAALQRAQNWRKKMLEMYSFKINETALQESLKNWQ